MIYRVMFLGLVSLFIAVGCGPGVSFVATQGVRTPIADDAPVRLFLRLPTESRFAEIGLVEVSGGDLAARVRAAKKVARTKGGNGIVLVGTSTGVHTTNSTETVESTVKVGDVTKTTSTDVPVSSTSSYEIDRYLVMYLRQ